MSASYMRWRSSRVVTHVIVFVASIALVACGGSTDSSVSSVENSTFGGGSSPSEGLAFGGGSMTAQSIIAGGAPSTNGASTGGVPSGTATPTDPSSGGSLVSTFLVRGSCSYGPICSEYGGGGGGYLYPMSIPKDACLKSQPIGIWSDNKCSTVGMKYKCYMNWGTLEQNNYFSRSGLTQADECEFGIWTQL